MLSYASVSAILADSSPPFPVSLVPLIVHHLTLPFSGSLVNADAYWLSMGVKLVVSPSDDCPSDFSVAEYVDRLSDTCTISLFLTGDSGQGCYLLTLLSKRG